MSMQEAIRSDCPMCKACQCPTRIVRLKPRPKQSNSELQVFVCSGCGLYQLVQPKISTRTGGLVAMASRNADPIRVFDPILAAVLAGA